MEHMIEEYIQYLGEMKQASANTKEAYAGDLKQLQHYINSLGIHDFDAISETNINSFLLGLEKQGFSPATINRKLVTIKNFILFAIKRGYLRQDVTERIRPPKYEKKAPTFISLEQVEALLNAPDISTLQGLRDKAMLEILYATGIKVSELIALKTKDVILKYKYVIIYEKAGERLVPFGNSAKESIEAYLEAREQEIKNKTNPSDDQILFHNRFNQALTRQGFWKILKEYANLIGMYELITPQIIRNSFAIHMISNGADLYSLKELMGHKDIGVTQRYSNIEPGKTREVYQNTHPRGR